MNKRSKKPAVQQEPPQLVGLKPTNAPKKNSLLLAFSGFGFLAWFGFLIWLALSK